MGNLVERELTGEVYPQKAEKDRENAKNLLSFALHYLETKHCSHYLIEVDGSSMISLDQIMKESGISYTDLCHLIEKDYPNYEIINANGYFFLRARSK